MIMLRFGFLDLFLKSNFNFFILYLFSKKLKILFLNKYTIIVNKKSNDDKIKDVDKEEVKIRDNSYVLTLGIVIGSLILIGVIIFVWYLLRKRKK